MKQKEKTLSSFCHPSAWISTPLRGDLWDERENPVEEYDIMTN
jgi:hypothetical protein